MRSQSGLVIGRFRLSTVARCRHRDVTDGTADRGFIEMRNSRNAAMPCTVLLLCISQGFLQGGTGMEQQRATSRILPVMERRRRGWNNLWASRLQRSVGATKASCR